MPPRPALKVKQNRPISAIYLGKGTNSHALQSTPSSSPHTEGTPPGLPDLPEPPSPSSSIGSVHSGLPSPPATNSTGSGSTGDPATIAIRERPLSHHSNSSSSGTASTQMRRSFNGSETGTEDDDYDEENANNNDNDNDNNDDTARLNENVMALQRVKNLAERNRMVRHYYLFVFVLLLSWSPIYLTSRQRLSINCPVLARRPPTGPHRPVRAQKRNVKSIPIPHPHHITTLHRLSPQSLSPILPPNLTDAAPRLPHRHRYHPQIQATVDGGKEFQCQLYNLEILKRKIMMD